MTKHSIATVITYCTNDYPLIKHCIKHATKFSQEIIVPYSSHFYDGSPENQSLIKKTIKENPSANFVPFVYQPTRTKTLWRGWTFLFRHLHLGSVFGPQYWICYARRLGYLSLKTRPEYVLFLDADEIIDSAKFINWLNSKQYQNYSCLKLANYWYWRSPRYQATVYEDSPIMIRSSSFNPDWLMSHDERNRVYKLSPQPKQKMTLGLDDLPMVHHYGWARPQKNLLKKVQTWGHTKDRNWTKLIKNEYSHPFTGTDFIYHRQFKTVKPFVSFGNKP